MKKKGLALILISALTMGTLVGCGGGSGSTGSSGDTPKENDSPKIGATIYSFEDNFMSYQRRNIEKLCNGKAELLMNDSQNNQSKQIEQVDTMIAKGVDILAINLVDPKSAPTVVDKAKADNLPVVFFNKEPDEAVMQSYDKVWYVGTTSEESGIIQGEVMAEGWKANPAWDKNGDGKIQYVMLEGEHGHQDTAIRTEYSIKTIVQNGIEVEKLADDTANWEFAQAKSKMTGWIKEFGSEIEVVFSNNDDMALGAIEALKEAEIRNVIVVGVDGVTEALEAVKNDEMLGTVISNSIAQAEGIFNIAYSKATNGDLSDVEGLEGKYIKTKHIKIDKNNVDVYLK